jgi:hypothetical protein
MFNISFNPNDPPVKVSNINLIPLATNGINFVIFMTLTVHTKKRFYYACTPSPFLYYYSLN